jgi:hypothetical protein
MPKFSAASSSCARRNGRQSRSVMHSAANTKPALDQLIPGSAATAKCAPNGCATCWLTCIADSCRYRGQQQLLPYAAQVNTAAKRACASRCAGFRPRSATMRSTPRVAPHMRPASAAGRAKRPHRMRAASSGAYSRPEEMGGHNRCQRQVCRTVCWSTLPYTNHTGCAQPAVARTAGLQACANTAVAGCLVS